jgi:serine phosphatase RsbU (regulator of sigma subunit)
MRPIKDLTQGIQRIAKGDFDYTVTAETGDEMQALAQQFNDMAGALKGSYASLEQKIKEVGDRTRELEKLEQLGRSIIHAPPDASTLPDVLREHVPHMFPHSQIEIRIFPDNTILHHPGDLPPITTSVWEWLHTMSDARYFLPGEVLPWGKQPIDSGVILAPIIDAEREETIGGIYLSRKQEPNSVASLFPAVQSLAAQIASALHSARDYVQILAHHRVTQELATAWRIQASFLPEDLPHVPGWQLAATLKPARETSGDFYDVIPLPGERLGIVIADVADKGVGAALYMALTRTLIRTYAIEYESQPELVLSAANRRLLTDVHYNMFVTVFYGVLDLTTGTLVYCNAGHNPPYVLSAQNGEKVHPLRRTGIALGIGEDMTWKQESLQLATGDVLLLYTDGVTEAQDPKGQFFSDNKWVEAIQANRVRSAQEIQDALIEKVSEFVGDAPQFDDIALMVIVRGLLS